MNFFEHQRQAKQKTSYLVFLFFLAVGGLILMTNVAGWVVVEVMKGQSHNRTTSIFNFPTADEIPLYGSISLITLMIIFFSALYKKAQLGGGGKGIAEYMGGVEAHLIKDQPGVKRAMNVVEEMAIAAGMTPPPLYILTAESSINAFAAGMTPQNSVIALSQGCLDHLTRDELQGVVAHELSHIFNGDTRLNVELLGYLAGIVTIGVMGKVILRTMGRTRYRSRSSKDSGGGLAIILFTGLALWIIGSLGVFVGRMIRSAVSRQREFLADASAAQFTRYPAGIAGALAKIGQKSSLIQFAGAEEVSHMCFENPLRFSSFSVFATHPPLKERIARLDKRFLDPTFLKSHLSRPEQPEIEVSKKKKLTPQNIIDSIGDPKPETLATLGAIMSTSLPQFSEQRSSVLQAQGLALALLSITSDEAKAKELVNTYANKELANEFLIRRPQALNMERQFVLASLHQCIPKLREMALTEKAIFLKTCEYLIKSDSIVDLYEVSLYLILELHLSEKSELSDRNNLALMQCQDEVSFLLSALAIHGHDDQTSAKMVFKNALKSLGMDREMVLDFQNLTIKRFRSMLLKLAELTPKDKGRLVLTMLQSAESDGIVSATELEFMKATCEYIGAPIPLNV